MEFLRNTKIWFNPLPLFVVIVGLAALAGLIGFSIGKIQPVAVHSTQTSAEEIKASKDELEETYYGGVNDSCNQLLGNITKSRKRQAGQLAIITPAEHDEISVSCQTFTDSAREANAYADRK